MPSPRCPLKICFRGRHFNKSVIIHQDIHDREPYWRKDWRYMGVFTFGTDERRFLCGSKLEYRCEIGIYKSVFLEI